MLPAKAIRFLLTTLALALVPIILPAQIPGLPLTKPSAPPEAKPAPANPKSAIQQVTAALAEARTRLQRLDSATPETLPADISPTEVSERRSNLIRIAFNLERTLKGLESADADAVTAKEAKRRSAEWRGFDKPPPYSFLFFDELRNQRDAALAKLHSYQATVTLLERQVASLQEQYRDAEKSTQIAADKAARAKGTSGESSALWRLDASNLLLQATGTSLSYYQQSISSHQPRITAAEADLALVEHQLQAVDKHVVFTDEDLATATTSARGKATAAEKELVKLAKRHANILAERDQLRSDIDKLRQEKDAAAAPPEGAKPDPKLVAAEAKLRAVNAEEEALSYAMDLLGASLRIYADVPEALKLRRELLSSPSADERARARKQLMEIQRTVRGWQAFSENEHAAVAAAIREQESRITGMVADSPERTSAQRVLAALHQKNECVNLLDELITNCGRSIDRWVNDDAESLQKRSAGQRTGDAISAFWGAVARVWNFSVYSYSDTVEVNGQSVTVKRGLSLGWLLGAVLFFLLSYRGASWVSRRIQATVIQRGWAGEAQTRTLRRWTMVAVGALLALFTLHLLKIPLTAFAFLGGALAIGFGFGTQTIFKNLISGIIVLAERKIKVGDILDVDGVIGKVSSVDTRSSTLRGFDGVETLIPNSLLLENRVTNWTHSNARMRRVVKVGVAYGSPLQKVAEILADCAKRHGLILPDPAPLVLLEDFGADSLMFGVYFWVELKESTNANQIASDLRFMIDKRFAEAGIVIAFPQRDIHLNTSNPLEVRMAPAMPEPLSEPPAAG
jgi:potassium efflux system protein